VSARQWTLTYTSSHKDSACRRLVFCSCGPRIADAFVECPNSGPPAGIAHFQFSPQFTDDNAACMIISEEAYVMLLTEPFFKGFTKRQPL
jgi:hypothetical protein